MIMRLFLTAVLLSGAAVPATSFAADCSHVGDDAISDANISNLQQAAATAEQRAAMARNPMEQRRWEATAQAFSMQAEAAQSRANAMANLARTTCDTLLHNGD